VLCFNTNLYALLLGPTPRQKLPTKQYLLTQLTLQEHLATADKNNYDALSVAILSFVADLINHLAIVGFSNTYRNGAKIFMPLGWDRRSVGVIPNIRLKVRLKWAVSEKPAACAPAERFCVLAISLVAQKSLCQRR